jgi:hypothetical protein
MISLMSTGTPCKGPRKRPETISASAALASPIAAPVQADDGRPGYRRFGSEAEVQTRTAQEKELDGGIPITEGIVTPEPLQ